MTQTRHKIWCVFNGVIDQITELKVTKDTLRDVLEFKVRCQDDDATVIVACRMYGDDAVKLAGDLHRGDFVRMEGNRIASHWWNPSPGITKANLTFIPESVDILTLN